MSTDQSTISQFTNVTTHPQPSPSSANPKKEKPATNLVHRRLNVRSIARYHTRPGQHSSAVIDRSKGSRPYVVVVEDPPDQEAPYHSVAEIIIPHGSRPPCLPSAARCRGAGNRPRQQRSIA